nr:DUF1127 domain-containing protein [Pseudooceanicola atlanticus]
MNTTTQSGLAVVFGQFGRAVSNVVLTIRDWNDRRVTRKVLGGLTDRELNDIGLMRADLNDLR